MVRERGTNWNLTPLVLLLFFSSPIFCRCVCGVSPPLSLSEDDFKVIEVFRTL